jgi:glycosyltransferase involved in cell wall biosynthesis
MSINLQKEVSVIPPAVDTTIFNPNVLGDHKRRELGMDKDTPAILYCGNWSEWKGVEILIKSMVKVIKLFPEAKLILAWGEPYDWYNERKIIINNMIQKLGLSNNIIEVGICGDIEKLMAVSNVYVAPFITTERVADRPLSILEAMACGKPIVATNVGGIPEIVENGKNGFLVRPRAPLELAEAICMLLEDKILAERMGRKGAEYVFKNCNIEAITAKYDNLYSEISNSR